MSFKLYALSITVLIKGVCCRIKEYISTALVSIIEANIQILSFAAKKDDSMIIFVIKNIGCIRHEKDKIGKSDGNR